MGGAVLKGLARKAIGLDVDEVSDAIAEGIGGGKLVSEAIESGVEEGAVQIEKFFDASLDTMVNDFNRTSAAMVDFRKKLEIAVEAISEEKTAPIFILVDELDRCRPTYAVQLLERVKHLFDVPGVVFVFGTNASQLQYSISGAYGASFDGFRYLKRFFDRTYVFEEPSLESYVQSLCQHLPGGKIRAPEDKLSEVLTLGFKAYDFDLRAISQIMEMIDATASAWRHKIPIEISLLFPLCAHFFQTGKAEWPSFKYDGTWRPRWSLNRVTSDPYKSQPVDHTIDFVEVYETATDRFSSMDEIMDFGRKSQNFSPSAEYARGIFMPEWNGVTVRRDQSSIQTQLLGLVVNAGKMQSSPESSD